VRTRLHDDGALESQEQAERRLALMFKRGERELFGSPDEIVAEAYRLQGEKIAYEEEHPGIVERVADAGQTRLCQ
jgi:hypothetical protein